MLVPDCGKGGNEVVSPSTLLGPNCKQDDKESSDAPKPDRALEDNEVAISPLLKPDCGKEGKESALHAALLKPDCVLEEKEEKHSSSSQSSTEPVRTDKGVSPGEPQGGWFIHPHCLHGLVAWAGKRP